MHALIVDTHNNSFTINELHKGCLLRLYECWPDLKSFAVIASERTLNGKTTLEHRYYTTSLRPDAAQLNHAAHNLSLLRHFALNLIRYAPVKRKGSLKVQHLRAASSIDYREQLLSLL